MYFYVPVYTGLFRGTDIDCGDVKCYFCLSKLPFRG